MRNNEKEQGKDNALERAKIGRKEEEYGHTDIKRGKQRGKYEKQEKGREIWVCICTWKRVRTYHEYNQHNERERCGKNEVYEKISEIGESRIKKDEKINGIHGKRARKNMMREKEL